VNAAGPLRGPGKGGGFAAAGLVVPAKGTGPPPRPQGCCTSRCARRPCGPPLTPGTPAAPGSRKSGQATACPRRARARQGQPVPGHDHHNRSLHGLRGTPPLMIHARWRQGLGIVMLCPFRSWRAEPEGCQGPGGVPGVVAAGGGDTGVAAHFQDPDAEVAQGSHDLGAAAGADLGSVFPVADVADAVQHLDLPVAAYPGGELAGGSLAGVQAGDRVDSDGAPFLLAAQGRVRRVRRMAWAACGKASPAATAVTCRVRCSSRPCCVQPAGMFRQGRFLTWAYRPGRFFFTARM